MVMECYILLFCWVFFSVFVTALSIAQVKQQGMASYYDEHDCEPLKEGEQPNHLLHLARCGLCDEKGGGGVELLQSNMQNLYIIIILLIAA